MKIVPMPHGHRAIAAVGWYELGNFKEAIAELDEIPEPFRTYPQVLKLRYYIHCDAGEWYQAAAAALKSCEVEPDDDKHLVDYAIALREGKRLAEARDFLLQSIPKFPRSAEILLGLSVCELRLGNWEKAEHWAQVWRELIR